MQQGMFFLALPNFRVKRLETADLLKIVISLLGVKFTRITCHFSLSFKFSQVTLLPFRCRLILAIIYSNMFYVSNSAFLAFTHRMACVSHLHHTIYVLKLLKLLQIVQSVRLCMSAVMSLLLMLYIRKKNCCRPTFGETGYAIVILAVEGRLSVSKCSKTAKWYNTSFFSLCLFLLLVIHTFKLSDPHCLATRLSGDPRNRRWGAVRQTCTYIC